MEADYNQTACIHQLFEAQAQQTPNSVAVIFEQKQLTYKELNSLSNQVAHYLRTLGVGLEVLVGICLERSLYTIIGLLGILKAGAAYLPLDSVYPQKRINLMLASSQVSVILTQSKLRGILDAAVMTQPTIVVCIDSDWHEIDSQSDENLVSGVTPNNLAYTIYTSGSTGKPKGVLESAIARVAPGGFVFVGDVRSLPLLSTFHTSVQLYQAPASLSTNQLREHEQQLAQIWEQVLAIEPIGIYDNFFELGGHSLLIPQLLTQMEEVFQLKLPVMYLFEKPTVAGLAEIINKGFQPPIKSFSY